ncbi:hypothetical protein P4O66_018696 [Electrophorus voltai]|uniref:Ig-like domain-containing protein n=1 Tax=Electrophorus voltai TaxID=2609070 RepID=A0AAD8YR63_9TELE|nr:hypothetical protein P4O66_018696 [Electrophorus voltai]
MSRRPGRADPAAGILRGGRGALPASYAVRLHQPIDPSHGAPVGNHPAPARVEEKERRAAGSLLARPAGGLRYGAHKLALGELIGHQKGTGQSVQMDMVKSGFVGSTVELRCLFINSKPPVKISQVTWQKFYNGTKQNVAIANPALGVSVLPPFKDRVSFKHPVRQTTPSLEDTTIIFNGLLLSDEAAYICEYTTFPAGNRENMVNLTVYARPQSQMTLTMPTIIAQKHDKMRVATCLSANGKPPSDIKWETQLKGEPTFQESRNPNGTVTVRSDYILVPSRETHGQKLTCVVTYQTERFADTVMLNVQYEPDVKIKGFDGNWYLNRQDVKLTCEADANPAVTVYQWKLLNGSLPKNVEIRNNTLIFRGPVTHELGGTYVCDATNSIGTRSGLVEVNVTGRRRLSCRERRVRGLGEEFCLHRGSRSWRSPWTGLAESCHMSAPLPAALDYKEVTPLCSLSHEEFPIHPSTGPKMSQEQQSSGAAIWGAVGGVALLVGGAVLLFFFLRRRQRTFKGDYSTKKHVFGNGYSKAGGLPAHPPMPKNLQYPDDSDDEKKPTQIGAPGGFDGVERDFDGNSEDLKRPYFTVDEGESRDYDERTLAFQYDPESEINDDMVSQTDGSVISKKEWYV